MARWSRHGHHLLGMASTPCNTGCKITPDFAVKEEKARGSVLRDEDPLLFFAPAFIGASG